MKKTIPSIAFIPAFFLLISILCIPAEANEDKILIGTRAMLRFFRAHGLRYVKTHTFAGALYRLPKKSLPGNGLIISPKTPDSYETLLKERSLRAQGQFPNPLDASIRPIPLIAGFGLFAERDFAPGEVLGFYAGEITYAPRTAHNQVVVPGWLKERYPDDLPGDLIAKRSPWFFGGASTEETVWQRFIQDRYLVPYSATHPHFPTNELTVSAENTGNETRFINHAEGRLANCGYVASLISYSEFLSMSGEPTEVSEIPSDVLIPIVTVETLKPVPRRGQFLADYGKAYWKLLQVEPQNFDEESPLR
jgi:hypothetical protein